VPGLAPLLVFACALTQVETDAAGRLFAAYGAVYNFASLAWLWLVAGQRSDRYDPLGVLLCLVGSGVILFGPRV
jgi:small multidrug resistance family-3 protein